MQDQTICVSPPAISEDGYVSLTTPVHRASTIAFPDVASYANRAERGPDGYSYGLGGTPTTKQLEATISVLEDANGTLLLASGQAAIMLVFLSVLKPGDTILIPDCAYPPVRSFCKSFLAERGIGHRVYNPDWSAAEIGDLMDATVKLLWVETPGSTTMEMVDVAALVAIAHAKGVLVGCDNTWATPLNYKPLAHGVDFVVEALTKYAGGHSDVLMGSVSLRDDGWYRTLRATMGMMGLGVSPDDCVLVLRGLETMPLRLRHAEKTALDFARRIAEIISPQLVLHPALPHSPSHALWTRDFAGASGVFSIVIPEKSEPAVIEQINGAKTFSIGASWGGTHSLLAPMSVASDRSFPKIEHGGTILRISIGLEDPVDLWADIGAIIKAI
ncbi:trans-sulfuration enzyme family protein [Thalassospira alkalitolerans]|uniref:trans-sulfuration enzyme family protein n=1 Tax=Thalassospira alkalitolerans TaxID=1293890 RepID=UPI003AA8E9D8